MRQGDLDCRIGVRLNKDEYEHLAEVAKEMSVTVSQAIRIIIREAKVVTTTKQVPVTTSKVSMRTILKTVEYA